MTTIRMRAAVLREKGAPNAVRPEPAAVGRGSRARRPRLGWTPRSDPRRRLCHSGLSAINGDRPWPMPIVVGHEAAAEVVERGAGVSDFEVGIHVASVFRPGCGSCARCAVGRPALCIPGGQSNASGALLGGHRRLRVILSDASGDGAMHHHGDARLSRNARRCRAARPYGSIGISLGRVAQ